jgi:hypothetical protein
MSLRVCDVKENTIVQLRELMEQHPGTCPCYFNVLDNATTRTFQTRRFTVEPSDKFLDQVRTVLGPESVKFAG